MNLLIYFFLIRTQSTAHKSGICSLSERKKLLCYLYVKCSEQQPVTLAVLPFQALEFLLLAAAALHTHLSMPGKCLQLNRTGIFIKSLWKKNAYLS